MELNILLCTYTNGCLRSSVFSGAIVIPVSIATPTRPNGSFCGAGVYQILILMYMGNSLTQADGPSDIHPPPLCLIIATVKLFGRGSAGPGKRSN